MLLASLLLAALARPLPAQAPLWIGFVAGNSRLSPVGRFDGDRWTNPWPMGEDPTGPQPPPLPEAKPEWWGPAPAPGRWFLGADDAAPRAIRLGRAVREDEGLEATWMVETDAPAQGDPDDPSTWGTRLATSRPVPFSWSIEVPAGSPERDRIRDRIRPTFRILERNLLSELSSHSPDANNRLRIESLRGFPLSDDGPDDLLVFRNRVPLEGLVLYYVEARRRAPRVFIDASDPSGAGRWSAPGTTMTAWLLDEGCGELAFLRKELRLVGEMELDRRDEPIAMLTIDRALSALLSWDDEHRAGLSIVLVREGRLRRFELYEYPGC